MSTTGYNWNWFQSPKWAWNHPQQEGSILDAKRRLPGRAHTQARIIQVGSHVPRSTRNCPSLLHCASNPGVPSINKPRPLGRDQDPATRLASIYEYLREYNRYGPSTSITMGDNTEQQTKKRRSKWITSYSRVTQADTEKRLGFRMRALKAIPVDRMLANLEGEGPDAILKTKERVYDRIVEYLDVEEYPTEMDEDFKEANINHLVYSIISTILFDLRCKTGRKSLHLRSEKEIVSTDGETDGETGGTEEFVVVDLISVTEEKFVLIVEAKRSSLGQAMRQCLLSMKDMRDNNTGGEVYGFVTTGESWQMLKYDGALFQMTRKIDVLFGGMDQEKELWMKDYSVLVDCMYAALSNGGIAQNN